MTKRLEMELPEGLAAFIGGALSVGADDDSHSEVERIAAERLSNKLLHCPKGARIIVEPCE